MEAGDQGAVLPPADEGLGVWKSMILEIISL